MDVYSDFYSSKCNASQEDYDAFLILILNLVQLDETAKEDLHTELDILEALKSFTSGKASSPDGLGCEFYKAFSFKLAPY